jgi:hypothetical protein
MRSTVAELRPQLQRLSLAIGWWERAAHWYPEAVNFKAGGTPVETGRNAQESWHRLKI